MNKITRALVALLWCASAFAASSVLISDTLKVGPENGLFSGTLTITSPAMSRGGVPYVRWVKTYRVDSGVVAITLVPNIGSTPEHTTYRVDYAPDANAKPWSKQWEVPDSATALTVQDVELPDLSQPAAIPLLNPRQINPAGATLGLCIQFDGTVVNWGNCGTSIWGGITGTLSAQTDLQTALNLKAAASHTHLIADTTGLQTALDGKSATSHNHSGVYAPLSHVHLVADITGLQAALDGKSATTHNHSGTYEPVIADGTTAQYRRGDKTWQTLNTSVVPESGNQYYTDARVRAAITASSPLSFDSATGILTCPTCNTGDNTTVGLALTLIGAQVSADDTLLPIVSYDTAPFSGLCNGKERGVDTATKIEYYCVAGTWTVLATPYVLPTAAAGTLGGVRVGSGLSIDGGGVLSTTSGSGESTTPTNSGTGAAVLKTGTNVIGRKIKAGTYTTVTENTDDITVEAQKGYTYGTSVPGTCTVGDVFNKTDATAGQNWYFCTATDTYTQQLNSGGGSTAIDAVYTSFNWATSTLAATSISAINTIRGVQLILHSATTVNSIGGMRTTAVTGETARLAVYDVNCNLMLQSSEISLTSTGQTTTTLGAPVTLAAGKYYFAWAASTTTGALGGTNISSTAAPPWTGNGTNKLLVQASVASVVPGAGMPASCGTWSAVGTAGVGVPLIWIAP